MAGKHEIFGGGKRFPLFISLVGKKIVMIGGGTIATRRTKALIPFGGDLTVIAPQISPDIREYAHTIHIVGREFHEKDLDGAYLVFATTNDRAVNKAIAGLCRGKNILVNVCDNKDECDFYFPALFSDEKIIGGLVSHDGLDHGLVKEKAQQIRACLEKD